MLKMCHSVSGMLNASPHIDDNHTLMGGTPSGSIPDPCELGLFNAAEVARTESYSPCFQSDCSAFTSTSHDSDSITALPCTKGR